MKELNGYREAFMKLPKEIKEGEAEAEKTVRVEAAVSGGASVGMGFSLKTELYVRATGKKTGMVYTENLTENPMEVLLQAYENSQMAESAEIINRDISLNERFGSDEEFTKEWEASELDAFARKLETEITEGFEQAGKTEVRVVQVISTIGLVNSTGVDICGTTSRFDVTVRVAKKENPLKFYEETVTEKVLEKISADYFLKALKRWEMTICPEGVFTPGVYRAVLSSQAVNFILMTGWQLFSAKYYQDGSSPLAGKLGEKLFSDCIHICDSQEQGYPFLLDSEGTPCIEAKLVENGVFTGCMHNLSTAQKSGCSSTGNGGRRALLGGNVHTDLTIVPKNFIMKAGKSSLDELIQKCEDGIYIYESYDQFHSLNRVTGDFNFPCKGILIRNGRLTECVSGLTINGNVLDLFAAVEELGKDRQIEPMAIYENYLVSGPAILVEHLGVSG